MKKLIGNVAGSIKRKKSVEDVLSTDIENEIKNEKDIEGLKRNLKNSRDEIKLEFETLKQQRYEIDNSLRALETDKHKFKLKEDKFRNEKLQYDILVKKIKIRNSIKVGVGFVIWIVVILLSIAIANSEVETLSAENWNLQQEKSSLIEEKSLIEQELDEIKAKQSKIDSYQQISLSSLEKSKTQTDTNLVVSDEALKECNEYIRSLPKKSVEEFEEKGDYFIYRDVSLADEYINVDPNTDIVFPGAIINGNTLYSDYYSLITLPRTSMKLSGNFVNSNGSGAQTFVSDVNIGSVRNAINSLVKNNLEEDTAANIDFTKYVVNEEEDISSSIGVTGGYKMVEGKAKATFDFTGEKTNMIIKFKQSFFQIDAIPQDTPVDYFSDGSELSYLGNMSPAYISSVSYGRIGMLFLSSEASEQEVSAAVEATVDYVVNDASAEIDSKYRKVFDKTKINVVIVGGSSENAIVAINGVDEFMNFIREGARYSEKAYIVPISYKLKYLADNEMIDSSIVRSETVISKDSQIDFCLKDQFTSSTKLLGIGDRDDYSIALDVVGANTSIVEQEEITVEDDNINQNSNQFLLNDVNIDSRLKIDIRDEKGNILDVKVSPNSEDKLLIKNIPYGASELRVSLEDNGTKFDLSFTVNHTAIKKQ